MTEVQILGFGAFIITAIVGVQLWSIEVIIFAQLFCASFIWLDYWQVEDSVFISKFHFFSCTALFSSRDWNEYIQASSVLMCGPFICVLPLEVISSACLQWGAVFLSYFQAILVVATCHSLHQANLCIGKNIAFIDTTLINKYMKINKHIAIKRMHVCLFQQRWVFLKESLETKAVTATSKNMILH